MANSKKIKRVYVCPTCRGNGYLKLTSIFSNEEMVEQCFDCDSQGEVYDYEDSSDFDIDGVIQSVH